MSGKNNNSKGKRATMSTDQELIDALTKGAYILPAGNLTENALASALALVTAGATVVIR